MRAFLFRGNELYRTTDVNKITPQYEWVHQERIPMDLKAEFDPAAVLHFWREIYNLRRITPEGSCPNCRALVYFSTNYMEMPEWYCRQIFDEKHGHGSWDRAGMRYVPGYDPSSNLDKPKGPQ